MEPDLRNGERRKILVTGGAGFIGSHLCDRLLARGDEVHALDNLSLGRIENVAHNLDRAEFRFTKADLLEIDSLRALFDTGTFDAVFHMAANSDIQRSVAETDLDLQQTFLTTWNVLDCARQFGVRECLFPSSSTVYAQQEELLAEDRGPLQPVSLYGAAKLASEAFLCAYAALYDVRVWIFRFPNVVGPRLTHGCVHDFIARLRKDPSHLRILGDGRQSKPYVHVDDLLDAIFVAWEKARERVNCFNIGGDSATSVRRIAEIVIEEMGLTDVPLEFTGGERGWPGDVPSYQYDLRKIHALGWKVRHTSDEAVRLAARAALESSIQNPKSKTQNQSAVIVAGGEGKRMRSLEPDTPKPLLAVGECSILEHQIRLLRRYEIRDIHLTVRAADLDAFRERLGAGEAFDVRLQYHAENEPSGTAGGVAGLGERLGGDFLVLYGDVMVNMDLEALVRFHQEKNAAATLVVHPTDHPRDSDLVELTAGDRIRAFRPKPRAAGEEYRNIGNAALYVLSRDAGRFIPSGPSDFVRDVFPRALEAGAALYGYRTREYLKDAGTPDRLARVRDDWTSGRVARFHRDVALPAVFFDRDGTLCELVPLLHRVEDLRLLPGVAEAIRRLNEAGILAVVATNQPMVAHGLCPMEEIDRIHARMETLIGAEGARFDGIYFCPHHPDRGYEGEVPELKIRCACRKPRLGLFREAARDLNIDLARSYLVGDATRDIEAGRRLKVRTFGVETGKACRDGKFPAEPDRCFAGVAGAVESILQELG